MAEVRAKRSFSYHDDEAGYSVVIHYGRVFDASDPAVVGREELFEAVPEEKATPAPVKRGPGRPKKE